MEKVTLLSLANSIEQLSRQFQSLVQCLEDNHNSPSKVFKVFGSTSKTPNVPKVLQHSSEKTKTDSSIAKTGPRHIVNQINLPGLKLPICVPVHFKPTAAMDLDYDELAIAAYLYGNTLMYNDEEELVLSYGTRAHRDVFRSLFPDREIQDEVLMLVAKMMSEMTIESGYWFLPPYFADSQRTRMDPCCMGFLITEICLGKDDCFKRVFIPVSEMNKECRKHWYLVVVDRVERQVILLDPNPTKFKDRRRKTAINLVNTFSFYHQNNLFCMKSKVLSTGYTCRPHIWKMCWIHLIVTMTLRPLPPSLQLDMALWN
ncbi:hypothetical protein PIB30_015486 [Stylosanthes scabra]|uniref:Ubiquitin-like protease family profile domain-containing protein n=1 Tax=Stylosanthes scabra TaxID=79078 RepID=A0ABU6W748_9FABA|nr:hypothetical protein [Stylosanthes scabra]